LHELKQPDFDSKIFFRWYANERYFVPTVIDRAASHARSVCKNIIKNAKQTDLDVMFEGSILITSGIDVDSIVDLVPEVVSPPANEENEDEIHRITKWKKVSLISLIKAVEVINV
ncbi:hypothetical protein KJ766_01255, partial [Patescibacteria group bacterium]|nr:hypothetical protein [Patescibacteria group bacterium]